jgi:tartrate-resistant acid phosphatase type 5
VLAVAPPDARIRFAVIGDYGQAGPDEEAVARLVKSWAPDFVITTGDNNYPRGGADTIDANVGQYYAAFIAPYKGRFGPGAARNRFFPSLGNHDTHADGGRTYRTYFTLPGNGRYYEFTAGSVAFFALDSDVDEPDGYGPRSRQARWFRAALAAARSCWRIAYFHHPPYASSGKEQPRMRWPFDRWGVDVVLSGHEHAYERLAAGGVTYFIVGLSGAEIDRFQAMSPASERRFNGDHGAMLVTADGGMLTFRFVTQDGTVVDEYRREKRCDLAPGAPAATGRAPRPISAP